MMDFTILTITYDIINLLLSHNVFLAVFPVLAVQTGKIPNRNFHMYTSTDACISLHSEHFSLIEYIFIMRYVALNCDMNK